MTFTNRLGQDIYIKFCSEDAPKVLRASDSRISFVHHETAGLDKLQVSRLVAVAVLLTSYACFTTHWCALTYLKIFYHQFTLKYHTLLNLILYQVLNAFPFWDCVW